MALGPFKPYSPSSSHTPQQAHLVLSSSSSSSSSASSASLLASPQHQRALVAAAQAQQPLAMALRQAAAQAATLLRLSRRPQSLWVPLSTRAISTTHSASSDEVRQGLHYASSHEWVKVDGDIGTVGITDHAQKALGDIVFVELPDTGLGVKATEKVSSVESVKAVSDINSPVSGTVLEVNAVLNDSPETVNSSPYEDGWFIKVKLDKDAGLDNLMTPEKYSEFQDADSH